MHAAANRDLDAIAMAHSGIAFALHPMVTQMTPGLEETFPGGLGYRVRIVSEGGKLNIKWLLEGEDPRKLTMLKQWLERRGLKYDEREKFVDCLLDWVDADSDYRINGVEDDGDYHAANRPLQTVDEIAQVRGAEPLLATEGWRDQLTLDSNGPIDVLSADPDTLRLPARLRRSGHRALRCNSDAARTAWTGRSTTWCSRVSRTCACSSGSASNSFRRSAASRR